MSIEEVGAFVKTNLDDDVKRVLSTTGNEYILYIRERDRLVEAENAAWANAELSSKLVDEHYKKHKALGIKMKELLSKLIEAVKLCDESE